MTRNIDPQCNELRNVARNTNTVLTLAKKKMRLELRKPFREYLVFHS